MFSVSEFCLNISISCVDKDICCKSINTDVAPFSPSILTELILSFHLSASTALLILLQSTYDQWRTQPWEVLVWFCCLPLNKSSDVAYDMIYYFPSTNIQSREYERSEDSVRAVLQTWPRPIKQSVKKKD